MRDISATGKLSVAGLEGPLTVAHQRDGYRKVEYDLKVVAGKEFVTPEGGWEVNESGQLDAMDVVKLKSQRRHIDSAFERHLLEGEVDVCRRGRARRAELGGVAVFRRRGG